MNLLEILQHISNNYEQEIQKTFKENTFKNIVKKNLTKAIPEKIFGQNFSVNFSFGQGRWGYYPWIGVFDNAITTTPQKGYDVVFLFTNE